jgi:hypothetical protein
MYSGFEKVHGGGDSVPERCNRMMLRRAAVVAATGVGAAWVATASTSDHPSTAARCVGKRPSDNCVRRHHSQNIHNAVTKVVERSGLAPNRPVLHVRTSVSAQAKSVSSSRIALVDALNFCELLLRVEVTEGGGRAAECVAWVGRVTCGHISSCTYSSSESETRAVPVRCQGHDLTRMHGPGTSGWSAMWWVLGESSRYTRPSPRMGDRWIRLSKHGEMSKQRGFS